MNSSQVIEILVFLIDFVLSGSRIKSLLRRLNYVYKGDVLRYEIPIVLTADKEKIGSFIKSEKGKRKVGGTCEPGLREQSERQRDENHSINSLSVPVNVNGRKRER